MQMAGLLSFISFCFLILSCFAVSSLSKSHHSYVLLLIIRIINKRFIESQQCLLEESVCMCACVCRCVWVWFVCSRIPLSIVNRDDCCTTSWWFAKTCTSGLCKSYLGFSTSLCYFLCVYKCRYVCVFEGVFVCDVCISTFMLRTTPVSKQIMLPLCSGKI